MKIANQAKRDCVLLTPTALWITARCGTGRSLHVKKSEGALHSYISAAPAGAEVLIGNNIVFAVLPRDQGANNENR